MAPKISKISKQAATGITRHITFTIPETLEIVMKPGVNTNQSVIMAAYKIALMTKRNTWKKITCKNLGQYRYCLINGILNNMAPLQYCSGPD